MDNIESYIWLFCLDHPDTNITRVSYFIEWIFVSGNYIFPKSFCRYIPHVVVWMRSFINRNHKHQLIGAETVYGRYFVKFTHILTAIPRRCYARLGRCHCDVTALLACPQRPYGALAAMLGRPISAATSLRLFWACSKLGGDLGDLGDLTAICSAGTTLCEISQRPSGDQRRSGRFCRSQRGRRPVWLGYYKASSSLTQRHKEAKSPRGWRFFADFATFVIWLVRHFVFDTWMVFFTWHYIYLSMMACCQTNTDVRKHKGW